MLHAPFHIERSVFRENKAPSFSVVSAPPLLSTTRAFSLRKTVSPYPYKTPVVGNACVNRTVTEDFTPTHCRRFCQLY